MIKLFPIESLKHTVFDRADCVSFLHQNGVTITLNIHEADILVARKLDLTILSFLEKMDLDRIEPKPALVWTHEPRFCKTDKHRLDFEGFPPIYIMNVYTRNVYFSNLTFYGHNIDQILKPATDVTFGQTPIVGLATYREESKQEFELNGENIDLVIKRQRLLLEGFKRQQLDIYGMGWPDSISRSSSRGEGWHKLKLEILKNYQFNIALENTAFDYYCTEKIWDSIKCYCLPIYSSFNNRIYETFPPFSFIDFDSFKSNDELLDYVMAIRKDEYITRLNSCIEVYNRLYETTNNWSEKERVLEALIKKIHQIKDHSI